MQNPLETFWPVDIVNALLISINVTVTFSCASCVSCIISYFGTLDSAAHRAQCAQRPSPAEYEAAVQQQHVAVSQMLEIKDRCVRVWVGERVWCDLHNYGVISKGGLCW
jgi:hypothetical protein